MTTMKHKITSNQYSEKGEKKKKKNINKGDEAFISSVVIIRCMYINAFIRKISLFDSMNITNSQTE